MVIVIAISVLIPMGYSLLAAKCIKKKCKKIVAK